MADPWNPLDDVALSAAPNSPEYALDFTDADDALHHDMQINDENDADEINSDGHLTELALLGNAKLDPQYFESNNENGQILVKPCNRKQSRRAAQIIDELILKPAARYDATFTPECPLSERAIQNSRYAVQDKTRTRIGTAKQLHKCGECNKTFASESYLDEHFDRRHQQSIQYDGYCLASLCPILDCDHRLLPIESVEASDTFVRNFMASHMYHCNARLMSKKSTACRFILSNCLPVDDPSNTELRKHLSESLCDSLACTPEGLPVNYVTSQAIATSSLQNENIIFYIIAIFGLLATVLFYCGYWIYSINQPMKGLRERRRKSWWHRLLLALYGKKSKPY